MEFSGRLAAFSIAEILQWAHNDRRTGTLSVRSRGREKWVAIRQGRIVSCVSENPEELYSRYLLLNGRLDPQTLVAALTHAKREGTRFGAALEKLGIMPLADIQETLRQHIQDSVCGLFLWGDGVFSFEVQEVEEVEPRPRPIDTIGLVMEGTRWCDEYQRMCAVFVRENVLLSRGARWPGDGLSPVEQRIVAAMMGSATLSGLYQEIKGSYYRFMEAAHRLVEARILEIGGWAAGGQHPDQLPSVEDGEDSRLDGNVLPSQKNLLALLQLLPRLHPVWLRRPVASGSQSDEARRLFDQIDGRQSLAQLLVGEPNQRNRRLELVLAEIRKGSLALLPVPADEANAAAVGGREEASNRRWWRW